MNETAAIPGSEQIIRSAWRDQAIWSETAGRLKAEMVAWRNRAAIAAVLGAFLETLAGALAGLGEGGWWLRASIALAGAIILAVVPFVARTKVSKDRIREWVRARSVSEALKEVIYRYLVGAPPFGAEPAPADLIRRCQAIKEKAQDLSAHAAAADPPQKERPLALTIDAYIEKRVNDQIDRYYLPKGRENARTAKKCHTFEFWLGLIAVVAGAMSGAAAATGFSALSSLGPWVAVITTASAAVTAHMAAARYDHTAMTYFATADRLVGLRDEWLASRDRLDRTRIAKFVEDCEHAISTENEAWLAEWTRANADA